MPFDFKKEYKELYLPGNKPEIIDVPHMNYIAVRGSGDPNIEGGLYKQAISVLYAVAYTIKMSHRGDYKIEGFFDYVVPPLEGFWWQEGPGCPDYVSKVAFRWISVIRLPDFVGEKHFNWAVREAFRKKKIDCSRAEFLMIREGLCVQMLHLGSYDHEPTTIAIMEKYARQLGFAVDITDARPHHEIYISDPRRVEQAKLKTVIRHPIKKK